MHKTRYYVQADEEGLEKILRLLRVSNQVFERLCADDVRRRLLEVNGSQKRHIERQSKYLRVSYTFWYNDGHGIRPVN